MSRCPFCNSEVKAKGLTVTECTQCHTKWQASFADPASHVWSELDDFFGKHVGQGALTLILHPLGTKVCHHCGEIYPEAFACCPELVKLAIAILASPPEKLGPNTDTKVLDFLTQHKAVLAYYLDRVARRGTADEKTAVEQSDVVATLGLAPSASGEPRVE